MLGTYCPLHYLQIIGSNMFRLWQSLCIRWCGRDNAVTNYIALLTIWLSRNQRSINVQSTLCWHLSLCFSYCCPLLFSAGSSTGSAQCLDLLSSLFWKWHILKSDLKHQHIAEAHIQTFRNPTDMKYFSDILCRLPLDIIYKNELSQHSEQSLWMDLPHKYFMMWWNYI